MGGRSVGCAGGSHSGCAGGLSIRPPFAFLLGGRRERGSGRVLLRFIDGRARRSPRFMGMERGADSGYNRAGSAAVRSVCLGYDLRVFRVLYPYDGSDQAALAADCASNWVGVDVRNGSGGLFAVLSAAVLELRRPLYVTARRLKNIRTPCVKLGHLNE